MSDDQDCIVFVINREDPFTIVLLLPLCIESFGSWDDSGCELVNETDTTVVCKCNHLTHFALLMVSRACYKHMYIHTVAEL